MPKYITDVILLQLVTLHSTSIYAPFYYILFRGE